MRNVSNSKNRLETISRSILGLKNVFQLSGFLAVVAVLGLIFVINQVPDVNIPATLSMGLIGVIIFCFGVSLNFVAGFPSRSRASTVIILLVISIVSVFVLANVAFYYSNLATERQARRAIQSIIYDTDNRVAQLDEKIESVNRELLISSLTNSAKKNFYNS